jgi:hypothetical protein
MQSLNNILTERLSRIASRFVSEDIEVEFDFDPDMPEIYSDSLDEQPKFLTPIIMGVTDEVTDAKLSDRTITKLRYGTLFVDDIQYLIIDHNGKTIPQGTLDELNAKLNGIYETGMNPRGRGDNQYAAVQIRPHRGRVHLENHLDKYSDYKVDTTVMLPIKAPDS